MASTQSKRPLTSRNTTSSPCRRNIRQSTRRRNGKKRKRQYVGRKILENKNIQDPKEDQDVLTLHWAKENKEGLLKALTETGEEQQKVINTLYDTQTKPYRTISNI